MVKQNTEVAFSWLFDVESGRFEHGGTTPGYTAHVEFTPAEDRGIVVLYTAPGPSYNCLGPSNVFAYDSDNFSCGSWPASITVNKV